VARARRLGGPGFPLVERVQATIGRYDMVAPGATVVVAVSGGPDSTALLDVLARLPLELTLAPAHVDHGLGDASSEVTARLARRLAQDGFDVHVVRAPDLAGPNLQARARAFRYGFLEAVAAQVGAACIATGHTLDDRVETTLARLVHGAGTDGLAGIPPAQGARIRPLIEVRRAEARAYCTERRLDYHDDPANDDLRFERVAVRRELIGAIESRWGGGAVRAMATSAERLREDAAALASIAERVYGEVARGADHDLEIAMDEMRVLPRALRRRLLEQAVGRVRDRSGGIDAALEALDRPGAGPKRFAVASGIEITVEPERVLVRGAAAPVTPAPPPASL
jgi:tRNA(Ile)-lysidine synthase